MRKNPSGPALTEIATTTEAAAVPEAGNANYIAAMRGELAESNPRYLARLDDDA